MVRVAGLPGDHEGPVWLVRVAGLPGDHEASVWLVRVAGLPGDHEASVRHPAVRVAAARAQAHLATGARSDRPEPDRSGDLAVLREAVLPAPVRPGPARAPSAESHHGARVARRPWVPHCVPGHPAGWAAIRSRDARQCANFSSPAAAGFAKCGWPMGPMIRRS